MALNDLRKANFGPDGSRDVCSFKTRFGASTDASQFSKYRKKQKRISANKEDLLMLW